MTWFRVDDAWWSHKKVASISLAARGLWVTAGAWCAQQLEDGRVPRGVLAMLGGNAKVAAELVRAGLWETTPDGWLIHDWHKYQPSRADVEKEREQKRERQRKWRLKDGAVDASTQPSNDASVTTPVTPAPSRPVPARPDPEAAAAPGEPEGEDPRSGELVLDVPIEPHDVSRAWHRAITQPNGGDLLTLHALNSWQDDYATIATVLNRLPPKARWVALDAVCQWFWLASTGPVQAGRLSKRDANPGHLAKRIRGDLARANEWFAALAEQGAVAS